LKNAQEIVKQDLVSMCSRLELELDAIGGKKLLITGGAGFLGFYLVQVIDYWNSVYRPGAKIDLTLFDNLIRGMPDWFSS